jgi:hypothetical protein
MQTNEHFNVECAKMLEQPIAALWPYLVAFPAHPGLLLPLCQSQLPFPSPEATAAVPDACCSGRNISFQERIGTATTAGAHTHPCVFYSTAYVDHPLGAVMAGWVPMSVGQNPSPQRVTPWPAETLEKLSLSDPNSHGISMAARVQSEAHWLLMHEDVLVAPSPVQWGESIASVQAHTYAAYMAQSLEQPNTADPLAEPEVFANMFGCPYLDNERAGALTCSQLQLLLTLEGEMIAKLADSSTHTFTLTDSLKQLGMSPLQGAAAVLASATGSRAMQGRGLQLSEALNARAMDVLRSCCGNKVRQSQRPAGPSVRRFGRLQGQAQQLVLHMLRGRKRFGEHVARLDKASEVLQRFVNDLMAIEKTRVWCLMLGTLALKHVILPFAGKFQGDRARGCLGTEEFSDAIREAYQELQGVSKEYPAALWQKVNLLVRPSAISTAGNVHLHVGWCKPAHPTPPQPPGRADLRIPQAWLLCGPALCLSDCTSPPTGLHDHTIHALAVLPPQLLRLPASGTVLAQAATILDRRNHVSTLFICLCADMERQQR